jgi:hypothetical protein
MKTGTMRRLVKMEFPCHTLTVHLGLGPFVHYDTSGHTSDLETIIPLRDFQEEPHFLSIVRLLSGS